MITEELSTFIEKEHNRLNEHYNAEEDPRLHSFARMLKMQEEVGELAEAVLHMNQLQRSEKLAEQTELEGEFADVLIVTLVTAKAMGVDVNKALTEKIAKIKARRY